ncbi:MAG TPA: translation elongation factor Ts, partial [Woeseiaceae bacterium]|nr:translation elongation factor Ts [Woeseiaceae bacterium]
MPISASQVRELRERTGAGMMECKKALTETDGDMEAAVLHLRKSGQAKADKKAGRVAADGRIVIAFEGRNAAIVEVNSETDFVAKDENFVSFAEAVAQSVLTGDAADLEALASSTLPDGRTVESARTELVARVGENISVRRFGRLAAGEHLGRYIHPGSRIGTVVSMSGGSHELARDIAMHVAASKPPYLDEADVPASVLATERELLTEHARESGKPDEIVAKMVEGRAARFLKEITLLGQPFVKDPNVSVGRLLGDAGARVTAFVRFELGEGIEKKQENFAEEVMAQVRGNPSAKED